MPEPAPLGEGGPLEARRKHGQRVALGGEATFIRVRRALDLDRVNRRQLGGHLVVRQDEDAGPRVQGAAQSQLLARDPMRQANNALVGVVPQVGVLLHGRYSEIEAVQRYSWRQTRSSSNCIGR